MDHPKQIGKYLIRQKLGQGAMGEVYLGYDPSLEREAAIKLVSNVNDDAFRRFVREGRSAAKLSHPNIISIYEMDHDSERPYLAMEYVEGEDLKSLIQREVFIPFDRKLDIVIQICRGLHYSHSQGILHRDIKPGNIRISRQGTARILDFGLVHLESSEMTQTGTLMGTPYYMSPEQAKGSKLLDGRTDLFGLAVVLYELIAYCRPFEGESVWEVFRKVTSEQHVPLDQLLPGCSGQLARIVDKALAKPPDERYGSCQDFAEALHQFKETLPDLQQELKVSVGLLENSFLSGEAREDAGLSHFFEKMARPILDIQEASIVNFGRAEPEQDYGVLLLQQARLKRHLGPALQKLEQAYHLAERFRLSQQQLNQGEYEDCLSNLDYILRLYPDNLLAKTMQAQCEDFLKQIEEKRQSVLAMELSSARKAWGQQRLEECRMAVLRALRIDPANSQALNLQLQVSQEIERRQQVEKLLDSALDLLDVQDFQACLRTVQEAMALAPGHSRLEEISERAGRALETRRQLEFARNHSQERRLREGLRAVNTALQLEPQNEEAGSLKEDFERSLSAKKRRLVKTLSILSPLLLAVPFLWNQLARVGSSGGEGVKISAVEPPPTEIPSVRATAGQQALAKADAARSEMSQRKVSARQAEAEKYAREAYRNAEEIERQAVDVYQRGSHPEAASKFGAARESYQSAEGAARTVRRQLAQARRAGEQFRLLRTSADAVNAQGLSPEPYQQAVQHAAVAQAALDNLDPEKAGASFSRGIQRMEAAKQSAERKRRNQDQQEIKELVANLEKAMNRRDLSRLKALWPSLPADEEERLRQDFAAQSIRVQFKGISTPLVRGDRATWSCQSSKEIKHSDDDTLRLPSQPTFSFVRSEVGWVVSQILE